MEKKDIWTVVLVALVVAVISSFATVKLMDKNVLGAPPVAIAAGSCDADSVCEVQGVISSANALKLSSKAGVAKLESDLTLTKLGQSGGTQFITNNEGSLTVIPQSGYAKLLAALTLTGNNYKGGVVLKSNEAGSLTITPQSGFTKLESELTLTGAGYKGGVVLKSNDGGSLTITPQSGVAKLEGSLSVTKLVGSGNAYACVDAYGSLFRSKTACK